MPHFKCLACKTRLRSTESDADLIGDLCPVCGSLLESVGDLGEIVGYRVIETPPPRSPQPRRRDGHPSSWLSTPGAIGANGAARRKFTLRPRCQATQRPGSV